MYQDYLDDIIKSYWTGVGEARFPQRLIRPTPANIKEECLTVWRTRFDHKDDRLLTSFFSVGGDESAVEKAIVRCDRDRFKPLSNFLRGITNTTEDLNIELLAWLIDFPGRPYRREEYLPRTDAKNDTLTPHGKSDPVLHSTYNVKTIADDLTVVSDASIPDPALAVTPAIETVSGPNALALRTSRKWVIGVLCIALLSILLSYMVSDRSPWSGISSTEGQKCMIWVGDHYIPSTCTPRHGDTLVVALDPQRIRNFRRITRPDTITLSSEGKVWYIKRNGHIEYYTEGGRHPIDPERTLRPLTKYMILKYQGTPEY